MSLHEKLSIHLTNSMGFVNFATVQARTRIATILLDDILECVFTCPVYEIRQISSTKDRAVN